MTRAFNNQSIPKVVMPRFSFFSFVLGWTGLLILMVRADLKTTADSQQTLQVSPTQENVHCECEFFVQSWKTSHMIRLPMGIKPVLTNSSTDIDLCVVLCQNQLPPLPEDDKDLNWARIFKGACRTLLVNDYSARHGTPDARTVGHWRSRSGLESVRGCLQAYARSADTHVWVPMGLEYRKLLSCNHPRRRRSLTEEGRKMSSSQSSLNSVDAQVFADTNPGFPVIRPPVDPNRKPQGTNASPLRMILKQLGVFGPVVESVLDMIDGGGLRELLDSFKLGNYVDRYQRLADDYVEEFDAGHCFFEYFTFTVFNNRFAQKATNRGLEDDAMGLLLNAATTFLKNDNASQVLTSLFSMFPSRPAVREESSPVQQNVPDVQDVAMNIARFYLRNYFSTLSGSTVRVDDQDPTNNPDSLADMIEQVSRPVFLSIFGVVPGVPAAGKLDHLLLLASKDRNKTPEFRNKLVPIEPIRPAPVIKTGNSFFDFGNNIVATFQRASDATHGLYCVKQYMVNKMWDGFRGSMRRMMRAIPSVG